MTITDETTEDIDQAIGEPPPELEGLLFGPINRDIVILFVADNPAATATATYEIYSDMCSRAPEMDIQHPSIPRRAAMGCPLRTLCV
jgi:hypothetical protein